ncbi:MAG: c-type cytochrome domain-containing protein [Blastocatellia bacterium]
MVARTFFRACWGKVAALLLVAIPAFATLILLAAELIRFGRDVLPILSANCFACHGPDERNRQAVCAWTAKPTPNPNGAAARLSPRPARESLILARLTSADPDVAMPPPSAHKQIKPEQIETLHR